MGGSMFLTLFFALFIAIGVGILGFGLRSLYMSNQAAGWPTVPGRIISSDFDVSSDEDGTTYRTDLAYTYSAMGREITGKKIAFGYSGSSSQSFHRAVYNALPVDTEVAVRYSPSNPERAVLTFGINQSIIFLIIFGAVWTMFTLGIGSMFWLSAQGAGNIVDNMIIYSR